MLKDIPSQPKEPTAARFIGGANFWPGIPMRDLTVTEWADLTPEQRELCVTSGAYVVETPATAHPAFAPRPFTIAEEEK